MGLEEENPETEVSFSFHYIQSSYYQHNVITKLDHLIVVVFVRVR